MEPDEDGLDRRRHLLEAVMAKIDEIDKKIDGKVDKKPDKPEDAANEADSVNVTVISGRTSS